MKYKVGDVVIIKKQNHHHYSKEFIELLERHDYKLTISYGDSTLSDEKYLTKEMQKDSYFKDTYVWGRYIEELYIEIHMLEFEHIETRFEILDL